MKTITLPLFFDSTTIYDPSKMIDTGVYYCANGTYIKWPGNVVPVCVGTSQPHELITRVENKPTGSISEDTLLAAMAISQNPELAVKLFALRVSNSGNET